MSYQGKWSPWVHFIDNRWVVAEFRDNLWRSTNTMEAPGGKEVSALSLPELVYEKGVRTYANINAAIKALKRVYNPADACEARPEGDAGDCSGQDLHRAGL